jgi:FAD:protein FMN transferase
LQHAAKLSDETQGAFDITIAPLVRCWGFMGANGKMPSPEEVAEAREKVGMRYVHLDAANRTVRFAREGVMLDLGAIGKGYAVERGAEMLREAGVTSALFHGGTSTVYAIGQPPDADAWKVAFDALPTSTNVLFPKPPDMKLRDEAMSVSAIWGRSFQSGNKTFGHVIDPRTGQPVESARLSAVVLPSATETDALSTALLTLGKTGHKTINSLRPGMRSVLVELGGNVENISPQN